MPYRPMVDRTGRILARCPQCMNLWKTREVYPEIERAVMEEAYLHLRRRLSEIEGIDREKAVAEVDRLLAWLK